MQNARLVDENRFLLKHQHKTQVLVVDDVPTNRAVLKSLLVQPTCEVLEAEDGEQALKLIEQHDLDLVVLDVLMPGLNGLQVLERVRARYSESELPILVLTVKDDIEDVVKALEIGANDYVTRPIDYSVLVARINALITYKRTQDAVRKSQAILESRIEERTVELVNANKALRMEVAERKNAQEQTRLSQDRYRLLYNDTPSMFFTLDAAGTILSANHFGASQLGYSVKDLIGKNAADLDDAEERDNNHAHIEACVNAPDEIHRWETCMRRRDNTAVWVRKSARLIQNDAGGQNSILVVCEDITETRILSEKLTYQARHDSLTGLVNRREFESRLQTLLDNAHKTSSVHALLYMDLDQFKVINDTCGHVAGDELLRQLGALLQQHVDEKDTLARLGGDEFAVLLTDTDLKGAVKTAENLNRTMLEYRFMWRDISFTIAASIGVVPIDRHSDNIASVFSAADTACYAAKEKGPKRIHIYQANDQDVVRRQGEMAWIAKINSALEDDRFELSFQRIIPVVADESLGEHYELLVRMRDEEGRLVTPDAFLPAAERYKSTVRVDRWVVEQSLNWLARNQAHVKQLYNCSINLSGHSISDEEFLAFLLKQLEKTGVPPNKICFEITETAAIKNLSSAIRFMEKLRSLKCRFALDDFGSGLSSFGYLKKLPVDFIKIDGQFIRDICDDPIDRAMVKSINEIAKVMGKKTIAEFVENEKILKMLKQIGVDFAQGNAIGEPQPLSELLAKS